METETETETSTSFRVSDQICQRFSLDQIRSATQNFDEALVIGRGGFGKVYKGDGLTSTIVAIKRLSSMSNQGALEFRAEVEMLSKIRHCNLVSLIGYCYEGTEMALVYEYMPQGTLEDHLHKSGGTLSWLQLLNICVGAARGLDYLHTGTGTQDGIIHRDVKSSNVLLDKNFAAKVSDFGLAKIGPTNQASTHVSTLVKGTFGYIDPCYFYTGKLTRKSDVYSFGVVLLEVICGRPAVDTSLHKEEQWSLATWAQDRIKAGKLKDIIDFRLRGQISSNCLKDFGRIAYRCLHNLPNQRPRMGEIVSTLEVIRERLDSSITEGKFIGKFRSFFQAKVDPKASEGEPNNKEGDQVNNAMVTGEKAKADLGHQDNEGEPNNKEGDQVNNAMVITGEKAEADLGHQDNEGAQLVPLSTPCHMSLEARGNLKPFRFDVLKTATKNFSRDKILQEDYLASVYEGWITLPSLAAGEPYTDAIIAVKRLNQQSRQDDQEWLAAINRLSELNHPNLVNLIGYCLEDSQRFLVCEFMPTGTLEDHLFAEITENSAGAYVEPLSWDQRMNIALGAARGLAYIHSQDSKSLCCDMRSYCILVDSHHNAKLSNFGIRKETVFETGLEDSYDYEGYFAKSEIYSFGVVLLEVLTGRRSIDKSRPPHERILVNFARPYLTSEERILQIVDPYIEGQYSPPILIRVAMLSKNCLMKRPRDRPTADEVVKALKELQDMQKVAQVQEGDKHGKR